MENKSKVLEVYAAYSKNMAIRMASSSGGIFTLLAEKILKNGGVVYGVSMSNDCYSANFIRIKTIEGLSVLRGSKYFQAGLGDTYKQVKTDLESKQQVLFSGTGCQVNGLKKFLSKEYENLYCVDVICHGVPSPVLWKNYVEHREKENGGKLTKISFRCKDVSWTDFGMKEIDAKSHQVYISKDKDPFMQMFLRNYCLRPSCYDCKARTVRYSDLTIADFWGIQLVAPEMNDERGISIVLIRTEKGKRFFDELVNDVERKKVSYEDGIRCNPSEYESPVRPPQRDTFFEDMKRIDFYTMEKKYAAPLPISLERRIKIMVKKTLRHITRSRILGGGVTLQSINDYGILFIFEKSCMY